MRYKIVPVEPTEAMQIAGLHHENMGDIAGRYAAMIEAAPPIDDALVEIVARAIYEQDPDGGFRGMDKPLIWKSGFSGSESIDKRFWDGYYAMARAAILTIEGKDVED